MKITDIELISKNYLYAFVNVEFEVKHFLFFKRRVRVTFKVLRSVYDNDYIADIIGNVLKTDNRGFPIFGLDEYYVIDEVRVKDEFQSWWERNVIHKTSESLTLETLTMVYDDYNTIKKSIGYDGNKEIMEYEEEKQFFEYEYLMESLEPYKRIGCCYYDGAEYADNYDENEFIWRIDRDNFDYAETMAIIEEDLRKYSHYEFDDIPYGYDYFYY